MPTKSRTPPPPRRAVQAPKVRTGTGGLERQKRILYFIGGSGIVALAVVLLGLFAFRGNDEESGNDITPAVLRGDLQAAGWTVRFNVPVRPNKGDHSDVPTLETKVKYPTNPPTGGPHYGQWTLWGFYDEPVVLVQSVHNLEHGGIVIRYGKQVPKAQVTQLRDWYNNDPNAVLVAPMDGLGTKIAMTAWTYDVEGAQTHPASYNGEGQLAIAPRFDEVLFSEFRDTFRYKGKERVPPENLEPGE